MALTKSFQGTAIIVAVITVCFICLVLIPQKNLLPASPAKSQGNECNIKDCERYCNSDIGSEAINVLKEVHLALASKTIAKSGLTNEKSLKLLKLIDPVLLKYNPESTNNERYRTHDIKARAAKIYTLTDVTILIDFTKNNTAERLKNSIQQLSKLYPATPTIIAISDSTDNKRSNLSISGSIQTVKIPKSSTPASKWNSLVSMAKTPLVLIVRDTIYVDGEMQLNRSLERLASLGVAVLGGAHRYANGHWHMGCHQSTLRNYTLIYTPGYYKSSQSCPTCQYIDGPFLIEIQLFKHMNVDNSLPEESMFRDLFLRLKLKGKSAAVCPFSMYHMRDRPTSYYSFDSWVALSKKWTLDSIRFDTKTIQIPCGKNKYSCGGTGGGRSLHPCCLRDLAEMVKFLFKLSEENGITSSMYAGTLLGAIKHETIIPWELDADILFYNYEPNMTSYKKAKNLTKIFAKASYRLEDTSGKFKSFSLYKKGTSWRVEWYGNLELRDTGWKDRNVLYPLLGLQPTKVNFDGVWLRSTANPGLRMWFKYKPDIYKHAQHNSNYGLSYTVPYKPRPWTKCKGPALGGHNCLNQYTSDGNIQFRDDLFH